MQLSMSTITEVSMRYTHQTKKINVLPDIASLVSINILRQPPPPILMDMAKAIKSALDKKFIWLVTRIYHDAAYMMCNELDPDREILLICHDAKNKDTVLDFIHRHISGFPGIYSTGSYFRSGILFLKRASATQEYAPEKKD